MPDTILLGIDGSDCCQRAVEVAAAQAKATGARLVVAYVIEWSPYSFHTLEELEQRHRRRDEEIGRAQNAVLDPLVKSLKDAGLAAEGIVRHGQATEVLSRLAQELGAIQIFVGRIGTSKLKSLLLGSVTATLVQVAPVPVTVVP